MSDSLAWTSALGEAYYNQPAGRHECDSSVAQHGAKRGNLKNTPQQTVEMQPARSVAQNEWAAGSTTDGDHSAGATEYRLRTSIQSHHRLWGPVPAPAGYSGTDLLLTGVLAFGAGILVGSLINDGHNNWGCNWGGSSSSVVYNKNIYVSNNNVLPVAVSQGAIRTMDTRTMLSSSRVSPT